MLAGGRLHLTAIAKLAPHLTSENREVLLELAAHRSKREIEELLAELSPRPDVGNDAEAARATWRQDVAGRRDLCVSRRSRCRLRRGPPTWLGGWSIVCRAVAGGRCLGQSPAPSERKGRGGVRTASAGRHAVAPRKFELRPDAVAAGEPQLRPGAVAAAEVDYGRETMARHIRERADEGSFAWRREPAAAPGTGTRPLEPTPPASP